MSAFGDLIILVASLFVACLFWRARQDMGRATKGTRLISVGLFVLSASAGLDAAELIPGLDSTLPEQLGYIGYALACGFLVAGFSEWLPRLSRLDREVLGRARAEAEFQAALDRSRRFNAGLEDLFKDHIKQSWDRHRLSAEAAKRVSALLGCARVSVWRQVSDGRGLECVSLYDRLEDGYQSGIYLDRSVNPVYFDAIESGTAVCVADALTNPITSAFGPIYLEPHGIGAMLDAPILTGRGVGGVVCCEHVGGTRNWTPEEVALVSAAAQYIAVAHLADNAEALADDLAEALKAAESGSEAKTKFLANMSHEIRTPLNGVLGMAQSLKDEPLSACQTRKVDTIRASSELLLGLLNDVLDMSKIEAGQVKIEPRPVAFDALLRETAALYRPAAEAKGLTLDCAIKALPARVNADPIRVRQVVGNLVSNAVKFTDQGAVTIEAHADTDADGDWLLSVTVADTGCGIDDDLRTRLFRRFSQADNERVQRNGGTGLGLAIAQELTRLQGGSLTVQTTPGQGSRFTATFKATDASAHDVAPQILDNLSALNGRRVLVVDDNEVNRFVARCFLEPEGVQVIEAESGAHALSLFADGSFDLVLLDAHMPAMNGLATLDRLRALPGGATTPVIALTADALSGDEAHYLKAGMDGYVPKPVDKARLLADSARLIEAGRASDPSCQARTA